MGFFRPALRSCLTEGARTHLRNESLFVARGLVFVEPLHLGDVRHLRDERLRVCALTMQMGGERE